MFSQSPKFAAFFLFLGILDGCPAAGKLSPLDLEGPAALELGDPIHQLPILADPKLVLLEVKIEDQGPFIFALDTGMSELACVDQRLQKQLNLPNEGGILSGDGGGRFGYQAKSRVKKLAIAGFERSDLRVLVANLDWLKTQNGAPVDGVLGYPLFRHFLLQIDVPDGQVRLYRGSLNEPKSGHTMRLRRGRGVPYGYLKIDGKFIRLLLDSGFDGGLALPGSMMKTVECMAEPRVTGRLLTAHSNDRKIYTGRLKGSITLAAYQFDQPPIQFLEGYRTAVLGRRALDVVVPIFDQINRQVHLQLAD